MERLTKGMPVHDRHVWLFAKPPYISTWQEQVKKLIIMTYKGRAASALRIGADGR